jgi:thiamine transport system substrate-binding protein
LAVTQGEKSISVQMRRLSPPVFRDATGANSIKKPTLAVGFFFWVPPYNPGMTLKTCACEVLLALRQGLVGLTWLGAVGLATAQPTAQPTELRVLVHSSFALPKPLLAGFEKDAGVKLVIIKAGDAGEMLNKLILTRAQPIADVVFGLDNALAAKAISADVLAATDASTASPSRPGAVTLPTPLIPVDYGYVMLNYDRAWFARKGLALPQSLNDLAQPAYRNLLAVQNPATSSPGFAFLLATVAGLGEEPAFAWWGRMRANGMKVTQGWSEAYYTEFTRNGGARPLVVSYASSPAAEVFYSKEKLTEPPTGTLALQGGVFRQVEGVALVKGGKARDAAHKFIAFLQSSAAQKALQTEMWMYPMDARVPRDDAMRFAPEPTTFDNPDSRPMADHASAWLSRWTRVVLK